MGAPGTSSRTVERLLTVVALVVLFLSLVGILYDRFTFVAVTRGVSMEPVLANNDLVVFLPYQVSRHFRPAREGDIIVFRAPAIPRVWAHRIVEEVGPGKYRTKGDNNPRADSFVVSDRDILGVVPVWRSQPLVLPWCGWLLAEWQSRPWLRWAGLGLVLALLVFVPPERRRRIRNRLSPRRALIRRLSLAAGCAVLVFAASIYPYLFRSGYSAVGYRVAEGDGISYGGSVPIDLGVVRAGAERQVEHPVVNRGVVPVVVLFRLDDSTGELQVDPQQLLLPPGGEGKVAFRLSARRPGEWRRVTLAMTTVPHVLPTRWVERLARVHPLAPNMVLSGGMALVLGALVFVVVPRRPWPIPRRQGGFAALRKAAAGAAVAGLLLSGAVLPGLLASTGVLVGLPGTVSVRSAPPWSATFAWTVGRGTVQAGSSASADLLWVENCYARSAQATFRLARDPAGVVADWTRQQRIEPSLGLPCRVLLAAPADLEPGVYPVVFEVVVVPEGGGLITEWEVEAEVEVTPAPAPPEPQEGEGGL